MENSSNSLFQVLHPSQASRDVSRGFGGGRSVVGNAGGVGNVGGVVMLAVFRCHHVYETISWVEQPFIAYSDEFK